MFGERLKHFRKTKGLTQKQLSATIGVSQSHISAMEKNEKMPGGDILISLKRFFDVDLNWLLTGDGELPHPEAKKSVITGLIEQVLEGMDEESQRAVLKYTEEKKLLTELLAQKGKREVNGI